MRRFPFLDLAPELVNLALATGRGFELRPHVVTADSRSVACYPDKADVSGVCGVVTDYASFLSSRVGLKRYSTVWQSPPLWSVLGNTISTRNRVSSMLFPYHTTAFFFSFFFHRI